MEDVMRRIRTILTFAALLSSFALAGCGDLSRSEAKTVLDGVSRGSACQTQLEFMDGGFQKARAAGALNPIPRESGLLGTVFKVSDLPAGNRWEVIYRGFESNPLVIRKLHGNLCLPGEVEITALSDPPFAPARGSYRVVEFIEHVNLPPELKSIEPYVYVKYRKKIVFQKTDNGWRVAQ